MKKGIGFVALLAVIALFGATWLMREGEGTLDRDRSSRLTVDADESPAPPEPLVDVRSAPIPRDVFRESIGPGVRGTVVDQFDAPIADVALIVQGHPNDATTRGAPSVAARSNAMGDFEAAELTPGRYVVRVSADDLPVGVSPPMLHESIPRSDDSIPTKPGRCAVVTDVKAGGPTFVRVQLWRSGGVFGYILNHDGSAEANALVYAQNLEPGMQALRAEATSDASGRFEFSNLYPVAYRVLLAGLSAEKGFGAGAHPIDVEVEAGVVKRIEPLMRGGPFSIKGVVRDQLGRPYANGLVIVYPKSDPGSPRPHNWGSEVGRSRTAADGAFVVQHLQGGEYWLHVEPEGRLPGRTAMENRLSSHAPRVAVTLSGRGEGRDVGELHVEVIRPWRLIGTVTVGGTAAALPSGYELWAVLTDDVPRSGAASRYVIGRDSKLEVAKDGSFEWACETPQRVVELKVRDDRGVVRTLLEFSPKPDVVEKAVVEVR